MDAFNADIIAESGADSMSTDDKQSNISAIRNTTSTIVASDENISKFENRSLFESNEKPQEISNSNERMVHSACTELLDKCWHKNHHACSANEVESAPIDNDERDGEGMPPPTWESSHAKVLRFLTDPRNKSHLLRGGATNDGSNSSNSASNSDHSANRNGEDCHSRNYYRKKDYEQIMLDSDGDDDDEDYAWFDEENSLRGIEEGGTLSKNRRRLAEAKIRAQKQSPFKFVAPVGGNNGAIHLAQGANEMLCRQTQQRNLLASVKKTLSLDATAADKGSDVNVAAEIWRQKRRNRLSLGGLSTLEGTSVPVEYLNTINTAAPVAGSINSSSLFIRENGKFIYNDTAIVNAREWQRESPSAAADECISKSFSLHKMNAIATSSTTQPDFETSEITQNIWRNDILPSKSEAEADLFNRMRIPAPWLAKKDTRSIEGKLSAAIDEESESNNLMSGNIEEEDETAPSALVKNFSEKDDLLSPVMNKDDDSSSSTGSVHSVIMSLNARSGGTLPTLNFDQKIDAEHSSSELINGEEIVEIVEQQTGIKRDGIENVKDDNIIEVVNDAGKEKSDINLNTVDKKTTTERQFIACGKGSEFFQPDGKENDENETVKCHFEAIKKDDHSMDYAEDKQENTPSLVTTNLCEVLSKTSINAGNQRTTQSSRSLHEYNKEMTGDEGIVKLNRHEQTSAGDGLSTSSSSMNEMLENEEEKQSEKGIDSALSETLTSNLRENETLADREEKREEAIFASKESGLNDVKNNFLAAKISKSNKNQNENYLRINHIGKNDVDCWSGVDLKASTLSASAHQRLSNEQLGNSNYQLIVSRRSNAFVDDNDDRHQTNGKNDCANKKSMVDAERMKIESNDNLKNSVLSDVTRKKDHERPVGNEFVKQNELAPQYCQDSIANGTTEKISIEEDTTSNDKKGRTKGKASRSCWNLNGTQWQQWASPAEKTVTKTDVETLTEQTSNFVNPSSITATESMVNQKWRKICGAEVGGYAVATLPSNAHKMASAAGNFAANHHRQNSSPQSTEIDYCKFAVGRKLLEREAAKEENKLQHSKKIGEQPTAKTNDLSVSVQLEVTREQCASISASCTIPYRTESCSPPISPTLMNVAKKRQRHHMLQNERLHFLLPDFPSKNNSPVGQKSNSHLSSAISTNNKKSDSDIVNSSVVQPLPRFDDYYNQQNERSKNIPVPSKNSQNDGGLVGFSVNNSNNRVTIVDIPLDNEQAPTGTTNYASDDRRDGVLNHNHRSINPVSKTRRTAPLQTWRSSSASSLRSDEKWDEDRSNAEYSCHNSVMKCIESRSNGAQQSLFGHQSHQSRAAGRVALVATPPRRGRSAAENSNQDCAVRWEPIGTLPRTATVALNGTFDDFKQSLLSDVNKNGIYCTRRKDAIGRGIGSCSNLLDKNAKSEYSRIQNNNNKKLKPNSSTNIDNTNNRNTFHLTTPTTKQANLSTNSSENDKLHQRRQRSTTVSLTNLGIPNGDCRNDFWKPNTQQQEVASNSVDVGKRSKLGAYAHFPSLSLTGNSGSSGIGSASQSSASAASPSSSAGCEDSDVANGNHSNRRQMQAKSEANNDYRVVSLSDRPGPGRLDDFVPEVERVIVSPTGTGSFCWLVQNTENGEFMEYYDAKPEDKNVIPFPAVAVKAVMRGHSSAAASPTFVRRRHASAFTENEVRHPRLICNYNLDPTEPTTTPRKATLTEPKTESKTTPTVSVARQFLSSANNFGNTTINKQQPQQQQQQRRKISEVKKGAEKITESDFLKRSDENREKVGQTFDKSIIPEQTSRLFSDIRTPPQPSNGQLVERDRFGRVIVDSRERRQFMAEQRMAKPGEASNLLNADSKMKIIHYGVGKTNENDDQRPKIKVLSNFGPALCNTNDYGAEPGKSVSTSTKSSPTVQFHQQLQQSSQFYDGGVPVYDAVPQQHPPNVTQRKTTAPFNSSKSINDGIGRTCTAIGQHSEHKLKQTPETNHHPITQPPPFSVPPRKNGVASTGIRAELPNEFPLSGAGGVRRHLMEKACRDVGAGSVAPISSYSVTTRIDANNNSIFPTAAERGKWQGNGSVPSPLTTTTTILSGASSANFNKPNPLDRMMKNGVNGSTNDSTKSNFKGFDARTNGILSNTSTGNQAPIPRPRSAGGNFSNVRFADEPKNEEFMRMQKSGGFMQRNNFCNNSTAEEEQPKREVKPENICSNCGNQLGSGNAMIIESMGLSYHISCFCCFRCRAKLADGSRPIEVNILYGSKLHCSECYSDATRLNAAERIGFANNERGRNVNGLAI